MTLIQWLPLFGLLGGCIQVGQPVVGGSMRTYVGIVQVHLPDRSGTLQAADVRALGIGWEDGPWLGWRSGQWVIADPARCQLLIVVRSVGQAAHAAETLRDLGRNLGGASPCVVDFTRTLRPSR